MAYRYTIREIHEPTHDYLALFRSGHGGYYSLPVEFLALCSVFEPPVVKTEVSAR